MLEELRRYEHLGTPEFFFELFNKLYKANRPWSAEQIRGYFYNRIIKGVSIFDGCIAFAQSINALTLNGENGLVLNHGLIDPLRNQKYLSNKIVEMAFSSLKTDNNFYEIFSSKNISYDIVYKFIQIDYSAFGFRYANFRQLLVDFDFIYAHPDRKIKKLIINNKYKKFFDREILPVIKRKKIGTDELALVLERKQICGAEAEDYVFLFERKRMHGHSLANQIEIISKYDVAAGYDIVSLDNPLSPCLDRFIEVKSFSGNPSFHWSRNEIDVSRLKGDKYFLYLVDRDKIKDAEYTPIMIQNPTKQLGPEWTMIADGYIVIKK